MISPANLAEYVAQLRAAGVTGRVKLGEMEFDIAPEPVRLSPEDAKIVQRSAKADYDRMLFAATEGIPDEEAQS